MLNVGNPGIDPPGSGWRQVFSGADGRFRASGFDEVELRVRLLESGRGFIVPDPVKLPVGENSVRIVAVVGKTIRGKVVGSDGKAVVAVSIAAIDGDGKQVASAWVSAPDGSFEMRGVPPGTYTLRTRRWDSEGRNSKTSDTEGIVAGSEGVTLVAEE